MNMDKTERERMLARRRQARRRERLRNEGVSVTVTLTHDEAAQLEELRQVRRMGKQPYSPNEFFQLLLIRNWQQWRKKKPRWVHASTAENQKPVAAAAGSFKRKHTDAGWRRTQTRLIFSVLCNTEKPGINRALSLWEGLFFFLLQQVINLCCECVC